MQRMIRCTIAILAGTLFLGTLGLAQAQQNCTTRWNAVFQRNETHCTDGSSATSQYNPVFRQWDTTIREPVRPAVPQPWNAPALQPGLVPHEQRCTTRYNQVFRQYETFCQ